MNVQSRSATLADVQRFWLQMAKCIKAMDGEVPPGGHDGRGQRSELRRVQLTHCCLVPQAC